MAVDHYPAEGLAAPGIDRIARDQRTRRNRGGFGVRFTGCSGSGFQLERRAAAGQMKRLDPTWEGDEPDISIVEMTFTADGNRLRVAGGDAAEGAGRQDGR